MAFLESTPQYTWKKVDEKPALEMKSKFVNQMPVTVEVLIYVRVNGLLSYVDDYLFIYFKWDFFHSKLKN